MFESRNPATGELLKQYPLMTSEQLQQAVAESSSAFKQWSSWSFEQRATAFRQVAQLLRQRQAEYARLITLEMGKLQSEALSEIEKCAKGCEYYAEHAASLLADEPVKTEGVKSYVSYQPLGPVLGIMPWNFPFWQVFRFLITTVMAGNTALVKHAPSVPQCAAAIEALFAEADMPTGVVKNLIIDTDQTAEVIADKRVQGVSLTGSVQAGKKVAVLAAQHMKKVVLELGGSDPFVVLADADIDNAVRNGVKSRYTNAGQICVSAKRFIVVDEIAEPFVAALKQQVEQLSLGDPFSEETSMAPMAREDLRDNVASQVNVAIEQGAKLLLGGEIPATDGYFYSATILDDVKPGMLAFDEEIFGPVASVVRVKDEAEALLLANQSEFGLGASVWTQDLAKGETFARGFEAGVCFVNRLVGSDIRLPFGGVKSSGLGRELSGPGIREFCNTKSIWIDA